MGSYSFHEKVSPEYLNSFNCDDLHIRINGVNFFHVFNVGFMCTFSDIYNDKIKNQLVKILNNCKFYKLKNHIIKLKKHESLNPNKFKNNGRETWNILTK